MSTVFPGQIAGVGPTIGYNYGPDANYPPVYLTGAKLTANGAAFPTLTFPAYASLEVRLHIIGYSASDLGSMRFNGDTGNNYWDRNITCLLAGTAVADNATASTSQIRFGIAGTTEVVAIYNIINPLASTKSCVGRVVLGSGVAATVPTFVVAAGGEWINTTAQITSLNVQVVGANNFLSGSSVQVFGGI